MRSSNRHDASEGGERAAAAALATTKGYDSVSGPEEWRGLRVYVPERSDGEVRFTGLPYVILATDGGVRWSDYNETMDYLRDSVEDDDEE